MSDTEYDSQEQNLQERGDAEDAASDESLWWKHDGGVDTIRRVWRAAEEIFAGGVDVSIKLSKPGSPILTVCFEQPKENDDDE